MKFLTAFILVVITVASAEPPARRPQLKPARQVEAPYNPQGWRPSGPAFNLPVKNQPQQVYGPPPQPSYGPPPEEPTTTELPTTTENYTNTEQTATENTIVENIVVEPKKNKEKQQEQPQGQFFVVLPNQKQNLIYATPRSAQLVVSQATFARLETLQPVAAAQSVPFSSLVSTSIFTPYSASVVQYYQ